MKTQSNINELEILQQRSKVTMKLKNTIDKHPKASSLIEIQESSIQTLDLRQLLIGEQFQFTSWEGSSKFPNIFVTMSPYMIGKFSKYRHVCHLAIMEDSIQSEHGLSNIALLMTLNSNLQPSILAIAIYKKASVNFCQVVESLLKFINQRCEIDNMMLYFDHPESIQHIIEVYNSLYSKKIIVLETYVCKEAWMKEILINNFISRRPYLKRQALQLIHLLLEEKDEKKFEKILQKFKQWNPNGYYKIMNQPRKFKFIYELPELFYGFSLTKKYGNSIQTFTRKLKKEKYRSEAQFINQIIQEQYYEMQLQRQPCVDTCLIFQINSRVKQLQSYYEPSPLAEFLQNYQKSMSFKQRKIDDGKYVVGGKVGSAYEIVKTHGNQWVCQCNQTTRLGIPCEHLLKICSVQKLNFEDYINPIYKIGHQKPFLRLD